MIFKCAGTGSKGNSYALISDSGEILLIECGVQWNKILKMIDYQTSKVVGCIGSHIHSDHLLSYKDCLRYEIQVCTNDETADHFEVISGEKMIGLPEKIPFQLGEYRIIPFYVPHDGTPNFAYIILHPEAGNILYSTDMSRIAQVNEEYCLKMVGNKPVDWSFKSLRLNHMIIESNYDFNDFADMDEFKRSHVGFGHHSLQACKRFIEANKTPDLRTITLIHLSGDSDPETMQKEIQEVAGQWCRVAVAEPGMESIKLSKYPW